jgi:hypothetical protein
VSVLPEIDVPFVRMERLELIFQGERFPFEKLEALQSCRAHTRRLDGNQVFVESDVRGDVLRMLVTFEAKLTIFAWR